MAFLLFLAVVYVWQGKMTVTERHFSSPSYSCSIEQNKAIVDYNIHFDACPVPERFGYRFQLCRVDTICHVNYGGSIIEAEDYSRSTSKGGYSKREIKSTLILPLDETEHNFEVCCRDNGITGLWFEWGEFGCISQKIKSEELC